MSTLAGEQTAPTAADPVVQSGTAAERPSQPAVAPFRPDVDYRRFLDCVHCGLCTASCPTYVETGDENDGPRGRIYLMRAVTDGRIELTDPVRRHLELCLDCRACETACPSGVQYGQLIEPFRVALQEQLTEAKGHDLFHRLVLFGIFPYPRRTAAALAPARLMQFLRLDRVLNWTRLSKLLPGRFRHMQAMLPRLRRRPPRLPEFLAAVGKRRAKVALFTGCVSDVLFRDTNWATARVLQANGCDVHVPRDQACCGAIHYHSGAAEPAVEFARQNCLALCPADYDAVITNVAGCGAMLKDYGHLLHEDTTGTDFAAKVRDISEFLVELGPIKPEGEIPLRATYHDACHLVHAQRIRSQPRQILSLIPGLELVPLEESELCCGAAGTYNLTEPEMSERLAKRKLVHIQNTAARAVFTANTGCLMQIGRKARELCLPLWVAHPIDVLDLSYRRLPAPIPAP